jgi:hypothetical protein
MYTRLYYILYRTHHRFVVFDDSDDGDHEELWASKYGRSSDDRSTDVELASKSAGKHHVLPASERPVFSRANSATPSMGDGGQAHQQTGKIKKVQPPQL